MLITTSQAGSWQVNEEYQVDIDSFEIVANDPNIELDLAGDEVITYTAKANNTTSVGLQVSKGKYSISEKLAMTGLLYMGADKDTIVVNEREIDGHSGFVGQGFVVEKNNVVYCAIYQETPSILVVITGYDPNFNDFQKVVKTIHIKKN
jgi:hypothetical protein